MNCETKINNMNNYIIHTAIKCSDGKVHRLSYDITDGEITEGSAKAFGRVFTEIEKRFPDVNFWIQQYPKNGELKSLIDNDIDSQLIHKPNTDNEV